VAEDAAATGSTLALMTKAGERLRDTSKWLIGTFGAVATVLVAGSQLSGMGKLEGARLSAAIVGLLVALLGLGVATWIAVDIMLPEELSLKTLVEAEGAGAASRGTIASRYPQLLFGYGPTLTALQDAYNAALGKRRESLEANWAIPPTATDDEATAAKNRVEAIGQAVQAVLAVGAYESLHKKWQDRRLPLFLVAALVAGGIATFAFASNPPSTQTAGGTAVSLAGATLSQANLSGQDLANVDLSKASLTGADLRGSDMSQTNLSNADLTGADLRGVDLTDANLTNANLTQASLSHAKLAGVTWNNTTCPDGTLSDEDPGGTCAGHT